MTIIFKAKTSQAYCWKLLAELLQNNIKVACFELSKHGIKLRMQDSGNVLLIDLELLATNFDKYIYNSLNNMIIGLNMNHMHKMLKCIKKKDTIELFIDNDTPNDLFIKAIPPKDTNRITISSVKIQNIQNIDIKKDYDTYNKPIIVSSSEYSKMCKDLANMGTTTQVISKGSCIKFMSDVSSIYSRIVVFGEEDKDDGDMYKEYTQEFETDKLTRITKIAGLSNNMQIFSCQNKPLLFKSTVGSLGVISIYIKSKEQSPHKLLENSDKGEDSD